MTEAEAIETLSALYGFVDKLKEGVFAVRVANGFEMFRLSDGVLEQRVEVDMHTCRWDVLE